MHARLIVEAGDCSPAAVDLAPGQPVTLGRSRDNGVIIRDDLVSRLHAKIYFDDGRWLIRDFGLNGTRVGGLKVTGAIPLADGIVVEIGDAKFRFASSNLATTPGPRTAAGPAQNLSPTRIANPPTPVPAGLAPVGLAPAGGWGTLSAPGLGGVAVTAAPARPADVTGTKVHNYPTTREPHDAVGQTPPPESNVSDTQLRVDELTALCRYMTSAMSITDQQELIRHSLRTVLNQTTATVAGYLSLDPADPSPKVVMPERAAVDVRLSRRLTEQVRAGRRMVWLFGDGQKPTDPGDSLYAFTDAACLPVAGPDGGPMAALHVYRTGRGFADRDIRFLEAVAGFLTPSLEIHRHRRKLEAENSRLRGVAPVADELIGDSSPIMTLRQQITRAAPQPFTVLIHGESGSGKELVAQALHRHSSRTNGPLVVVNCAAIAPTLLEAELFGYRKGAFSGADRDHPGLFEQADDGTLFLDEVGELSLECQAKLLRIIEGKPFRPVGGTRDVKVDVRVIAATHKDLELESKAGRFRQDLLFRLKVIVLRVPPLREHPEDIFELARFFLERLSVQCRRTFKLTNGALTRLQAYSWPGNVRQLRAVLESAAVMSESDLIDADALPLGGSVSEVAPSSADLPGTLDIDELETWAIRRALKQTGGNVSQAARVLGMSRDTLHTKLKKKGIDREALLQGAAADE